MLPIYYLIVIIVGIGLMMFMESRPESNSNWWKDSSPDKWRWFGYYNKEDKRLFIWGRKYGIGWTINNANPYCIIIYLLSVALIVVVVKYA